MPKTARWTSLILLLALTLAPGCANLRHQLTPGSLKNGSRVHAFQTASFSYSFMNGHSASWKARLDKLERDATPFLKALKERPQQMQIRITPRTVNAGTDAELEDYSVDLAFSASEGAASEPLVLHAKAGTDESAYRAELSRVAEQAGLDADLVMNGHFAIYAVATMLTELNVSNDTLQRRAFALLVLRQKIKNGEQADYLSPTREAGESLEDIEVSLRVIAEHHAHIGRWRAEVLGLVGLIGAYHSERALDLLGEQVNESRAAAVEWQQKHHQPTMEEFGVAMNELGLPTPDSLLEALDENGYLAAAIQIAKGVVTGSPSATIEGLAKLAPKDSSIRTSLEGLSAAARGDFLAAAEAARKLARKQPAVQKLNERLETMSELAKARPKLPSAPGVSEPG